jgi:hypothetical protein
LKDILNQDFLGRDIEWVLVIPLWKYINNSNNLYEFVFGIGQEISEKDLFLIWDKNKKEVSLLNLKYNAKRRNIMSFHELHNLAVAYGLDDVESNKETIRYATIENIKEYLKLIKKDDGRIIESYHKDKFLLSLRHLRTELKHLNITVNILREASLILLKDVYDTRHNIKQKRSKSSLEYDPYSAVRDFLRFIALYAERRGGSVKRPGRIHNDELKDIKQYLLNECKCKGLKEPARKLVKEIFIRESGHTPSEALVKKIKKDISVKLKHS